MAAAASHSIPQDVLRRELRAELVDIEKKLTSFHRVDATVRSIEAWRVGFRSALGSGGDVETTRKTHVAALQKILQNEPADSTHPAVVHMRTWLAKQPGEVPRSVVVLDPLAELERQLQKLDLDSDAAIDGIRATRAQHRAAFDEGLQAIQGVFDGRMQVLQPQADQAAASASELAAASQVLSQDVANAAQKAKKLDAQQQALMKEIVEAARKAEKKRKKNRIIKGVVIAAAVAAAAMGAPTVPPDGGVGVGISIPWG